MANFVGEFPSANLVQGGPQKAAESRGTLPEAFVFDDSASIPQRTDRSGGSTGFKPLANAASANHSVDALIENGCKKVQLTSKQLISSPILQKLKDDGKSDDNRSQAHLDEVSLDFDVQKLFDKLKVKPKARKPSLERYQAGSRQAPPISSGQPSNIEGKNETDLRAAREQLKNLLCKEENADNRSQQEEQTSSGGRNNSYQPQRFDDSYQQPPNSPDWQEPFPPVYRWGLRYRIGRERSCYGLDDPEDVRYAGNKWFPKSTERILRKEAAEREERRRNCGQESYAPVSRSYRSNNSVDAMNNNQHHPSVDSRYNQPFRRVQRQPIPRYPRNLSSSNLPASENSAYTKKQKSNRPQRVPQNTSSGDGTDISVDASHIQQPSADYERSQPISQKSDSPIALSSRTSDSSDASQQQRPATSERPQPNRPFSRAPNARYAQNQKPSSSVAKPANHAGHVNQPDARGVRPTNGNEFDKSKGNYKPIKRIFRRHYFKNPFGINGSARPNNATEQQTGRNSTTAAAINREYLDAENAPANESRDLNCDKNPTQPLDVNKERTKIPFDHYLKGTSDLSNPGKILAAGDKPGDIAETSTSEKSGKKKRRRRRRRKNVKSNLNENVEAAAAETLNWIIDKVVQLTEKDPKSECSALSKIPVKTQPSDNGFEQKYSEQHREQTSETSTAAVTQTFEVASKENAAELSDKKPPKRKQRGRRRPRRKRQETENVEAVVKERLDFIVDTVELAEDKGFNLECSALAKLLVQTQPSNNNNSMQKCLKQRKEETGTTDFITDYRPRRESGIENVSVLVTHESDFENKNVEGKVEDKNMDEIEGEIKATNENDYEKKIVEGEVEDKQKGGIERIIKVTNKRDKNVGEKVEYKKIDEIEGEIKMTNESDYENKTVEGKVVDKQKDETEGEIEVTNESDCENKNVKVEVVDKQKDETECVIKVTNESDENKNVKGTVVEKKKDEIEGEIKATNESDCENKNVEGEVVDKQKDEIEGEIKATTNESDYENKIVEEEVVDKQKNEIEGEIKVTDESDCENGNVEEEVGDKQKDEIEGEIKATTNESDYENKIVEGEVVDKQKNEIEGEIKVTNESDCENGNVEEEVGDKQKDEIEGEIKVTDESYCENKNVEGEVVDKQKSESEGEIKVTNESDCENKNVEGEVVDKQKDEMEGEIKVMNESDYENKNPGEFQHKKNEKDEVRDIKGTTEKAAKIEADCELEVITVDVIADEAKDTADKIENDNKDVSKFEDVNIPNKIESEEKGEIACAAENAKHKVKDVMRANITRALENVEIKVSDLTCDDSGLEVKNVKCNVKDERKNEEKSKIAAADKIKVILDKVSEQSELKNTNAPAMSEQRLDIMKLFCSAEENADKKRITEKVKKECQTAIESANETSQKHKQHLRRMMDAAQVPWLAPTVSAGPDSGSENSSDSDQQFSFKQQQSTLSLTIAAQSKHFESFTHYNKAGRMAQDHSRDAPTRANDQAMMENEVKHHSPSLCKDQPVSKARFMVDVESRSVSVKRGSKEPMTSCIAGMGKLIQTKAHLETERDVAVKLTDNNSLDMEKMQKRKKKDEKAIEISTIEKFNKAKQTLMKEAGKDGDESLKELISEQKPMSEMEWEAIRRYYAKNKADESRQLSESEFQEVKYRKKVKKKTNQEQKSGSTEHVAESGEDGQNRARRNKKRIKKQKNKAGNGIENGSSDSFSTTSSTEDLSLRVTKLTSSKASPEPASIDKSEGKGLKLKYSKANDNMSVVDFLGQTQHGDNSGNEARQNKQYCDEMEPKAALDNFGKVLKQLKQPPAHVRYVTGDCNASKAVPNQPMDTGDSVDDQRKKGKIKAAASSSWTSSFESPEQENDSFERGMSSAPHGTNFTSNYVTAMTPATRSTTYLDAIDCESAIEESLVTTPSKSEQLVTEQARKNGRFCGSKSRRKGSPKWKASNVENRLRQTIQSEPEPVAKIEMEFPRAFDAKNGKQEELSDASVVEASRGRQRRSRRKRRGRNKNSDPDQSSAKSSCLSGTIHQKMMKKTQNRQFDDQNFFDKGLRSLELNGVKVFETNENKIEISYDGIPRDKKQSGKFVFDEIVLALASENQKLNLSEQERLNLLKNLNPSYRRTIVMQTLRDRFCYLLLPFLVVLLILSVIFGCLFSFAFFGVPHTTTTTTSSDVTTRSTVASFRGRPLAPIYGVLHILKQPDNDPNLRKFAGQWRKSIDSVEWSQNVLSPALVEIYREAGLFVDGVLVNDLALFSGAKEQNKPVIIDHVIYPRSSQDGPIILQDLVRRVRFVLYKKKWIFDPHFFSLSQGNLTAKAVTLQSFLAKDVPPLDLHSSSKGATQIINKKTCPSLLIHDGVQVYPLDCKVNLQNPVNQTCRLFCNEGYTLEGDEYTVCLANGVWSGRQALCVRYCPILQPLQSGRIMPLTCTNKTYEEGVPARTRCVHFCDTNHQLFGVPQRMCKEDGNWTYETPICKRECPELSQIMFGRISPAHCSAEKSVEDFSCTFSCLNQYLLDGPATSTCTKSGWSAKNTPTCRKYCYSLKPVDNAEVSPEKCRSIIFEGDSCSFSCREGFILIGSRVRSCLGEDRWSGEAPMCVPACSPLGDIAHGKVTPITCASSPQVVFSHCAFDCEDGFALEGKENTTCYENGVWSEKKPECLPQCHPLMTPENGILHCDGKKQSSTCVLHCSPSHKLHGAKIVTCRKNGEWNEPLGTCLGTCSKLDAPKHGFITPEKCSLIESSVNFSCYFSCKKSHGISGSLFTQCKGNQIWSTNSAVCTPEKQYFFVLNENEHHVCLTGEAGSAIPVKRDLKQCTGEALNYWSFYKRDLIKNAGNGQCIGYDPPTKMAKLTFLPCDASDQRQIWEFEWKEVSLKMRYYPYFIGYGYSSAGEVIATDWYTPLVKWMLFNPETMLTSTFYGAANNGDCPRLKVSAKGFWFPDSCYEGPSADGSTCTFSCASGFEQPNQPLIVTCAMGQWENLEELSCFQSCPGFMRFDHATVTPAECFSLNFVPRGTSCTFACHHEFALIGEKNAVCLTDGRWSALKPKCLRFCPPITAPTNASVSVTKSCEEPTAMQLVGTVCGIECDKGYVVIGSSASKCLENGTWNATDATCERACQKPEPPSLGKVICPENKSLYPVKTSCTYNCSEGKILHPDVQSVTCLNTGTWSNHPPSCQNFCPALLPLSHGKIVPPVCTDSLEKFPNAFACAFSCNINFSLKGNKEATCLSSGKWSDDPPVCKSDLHFLLVHEIETVPLVCIAAIKFLYYNQHRVMAEPFARCNQSHSLHLWTFDSLNRIQNVGTGQCLSVVMMKEGEKLMLSECGSVDHQEWESILENQYALVRLHWSALYLQYQDSYIFISKAYKHLEDISWTAYDLSSERGTLSGMRFGGEKTCPKLLLPATSSISPSKCLSLVTVNTKCTIKCQEGHQLLSGNSTTELQCNKLGVWSTFDIYCKRRQCPPLPSNPYHTFIDNPTCTVSSFSAFSNQSCTYSCSKNFYLELPGGLTGILRCLGNGRWSEPVPKCIQYCKPLKTPINAKISPEIACTENDKAIFGQVCTFVCKPHFYLKGSQFLRCNTLGKWNGTEPICVELSGSGQCGGITSVNNGKLQPLFCYGTIVPQKTVCRVTCNDGYATVPNEHKEIECQANSQWSSSLATCKKICDLFPAPSHGYLEPEACENGIITEGESCFVVCQRGYTLTSSGQVNCLSTGYFDATSVHCQPKAQFMIQSSNECAQADESVNSWVYFETCSLDELSQWWEWIDRRRIKNVQTQTCLAPSDLNSYAPGKLFDCNAVTHDWDCSVVDGKNEGLAYNNQLYVAKPNTEPPNILVVVDPEKDDASWLPKRITKLHAAGKDNLNARPCLFRPSSNCPPLPEIANGFIEKNCEGLDGDIVPGTTCSYFCKQGYLLKGKVERYCQESGEWSNITAAQCELACQPLHIPEYAIVTPETCREKLMAVGKACDFTCITRFDLIGSRKRFCQPDGTWSGLPTICHQPCPPVTMTPLLTVTPKTCTDSSQKIGTICTAKCPFGYSLVGVSINVCQYNGEWSGAIKGCKRSCDPLEKIANGQILPSNCNEDGKHADENCVVSCNAHYGLRGSRVRTCLSNGLWSGFKPNCLQKCKTLPAPRNGLILCNHQQSLVGDVCQFSCNVNYVLNSESDIRICQENGEWSGKIIDCKREKQFLIFESLPGYPESCLAVDKYNNVTASTGDFCNHANNSVRWAWHEDSSLRHSLSQLCLAGTAFPVGNYLILKGCDRKDINQIWDCGNPKRGWYMRLSKTEETQYPLYSPMAKTHVLLFSAEGLDFVLNGSLGTHQHNQWYATTPFIARESLCSVKTMESCEPLEVYQPLVVEPSSCSSPLIPIGTLCHVSCLKGHMLDRLIDMMECMIGGRWSHALPTCLTACDSFSGQNQDLIATPSTCLGNYHHPESFVCSFSCTSDMQLVGIPSLTCQENSQWNYDIPKCKPTCPSLAVVKDARAIPENCTEIGSRHKEGFQCRYVCLQPRHEFSQLAVRTCLSNGSWNGFEGSCAKLCPALLPSTTLHIEPNQCISQKSAPGTVCTYNCPKDMIQLGPKKITCLANGTWTDDQPRCLVACPILLAPLNAEFEPKHCENHLSQPGQKCALHCTSEYTVEGNEFTECLENGSWSQPLGKCFRHCEKLLEVSNGKVEPRSCASGIMHFGQECFFECDFGFVLQGSSVRYCLSNGLWSGTETKCSLGCKPIGPGVNIDYSPTHCEKQIQKSKSVCKATCKAGTQTHSGLFSSEATCDNQGKWNTESIKACYSTCKKPVVANGEVECFQQDGTPTSSYTMSTVCRVVCNKNFITSSVAESTCDMVDRYSKWSPPLTTCQYETDPMLIINRVQYEMVCLGVEHKRVVLVDWPNCKNSSRNSQWVWYNEFLIQNSATGLCIDASQTLSNTYVTTSECDLSNPMQQWTCSNEDPYLVRLVNHALHINTAIKQIHGVVLTKQKQEFSKLYSYNPQTVENHGTVCSRRSLHLKGDVCVLPNLPPMAKFDYENCFPSNGIKPGTECTVICNAGLTSTIKCQTDGLWNPHAESLCKNQCEPFAGLKKNAVFLENECKDTTVSFGTYCTLGCKDRFVLVGHSNGTNCSFGGRWTPMFNYSCQIGCPKITHVDNGVITPSKCVTGVCSLECLPGYRIGGPQSRTCQSNGQWSGSSFSCIIDVQFSIVSSLKYKLHSLCLEATSSSDVVKAKCSGVKKIQRWRWSSHFTIENVVTRQCLAIVTSQVQSSNDYQQPDAIASGIFINTDSNNIIPIKLVGDGRRIVITKVCDAMDFTQRWNCGSQKDLFLHLVGREIYLDTGALFRSNLDISKNTKAKSIKWLGRYYGKEKSVCAYRKAGTCLALKDPTNGLVEQTLCKSDYVQPGARCTYACIKPFVLYGHKSTTCLDNGKWSSMPPSCRGKSSCRSLDPISSLLIEPLHCSLGLVLEGQECKIECRGSTKQNGNSQLMCLPDGSWSGSVPFCHPVCPAIQPPALGSVKPKQCERGLVQPPFVCASQCFLNRTLIGAVNRTCLDDGSWEGEQPACAHFCPPLGRLNNGKIAPKACGVEVSASGATCDISCNFGFSVNGKAKLTCVNGEWSGKLPSCKKDHCKRIQTNRNTENVVYSGLRNGAIVASSVANITCKFGYHTETISARVCLPNAKWSVVSNVCKPINCPPLKKLYHGMVSPRNCTESKRGIRVETICYFTCKTGYLLDGTTSKKCLLGGVWDHPSFTASCLDTLPKVQPAIFSIQVYTQEAHGNAIVQCLQSTSDDDGLYLENCDERNFFQLWNWYGSTQIKSIGNQQCIRFGRGSSAKKERKLIKHLHQGVCDFNQTKAIECLDISSPLRKMQITIEGSIIDFRIIGRRGSKNLVSWSGKWIDNRKSTTYVMTPQINFGRTPICSFMCGGNFIADKGDFSSPNYPSNYPNNIHCVWNIKTETPSQELLLDFSFLKFQRSYENSFPDDECFYDYVEIFEVQANGTNFVQRFCTDNVKTTRFTTLHGHFKVVFYSDNIEVGSGGTGWAAHWWSRPWPIPNRYCGKTINNLPVLSDSSTPAAAPWQVLVIYREQDLCNGAIFSSHFVLTSARCVEIFHNRTGASNDLPILILHGFESQANLIKRYQAKEFIAARKLWMHPKYTRSSFENDLAVVMTDKEMDFGSDIAPICLPSIKEPSVAIMGSARCWGIQWSRDFFTHKHSTWDFTYYSHLTLLKRDDCEKILQRHKNTKSKSKLICAQEAEYLDTALPLVPRSMTSRHENDEGSILQCNWNNNWYLIGTSSFAFKDDYGKPVYIYTGIRAHNTWILETSINSHYYLRDEYLNTFA